MRVGDMIINPYVNKDFDGELNAMYATIYLGDNKSLDYIGRVHTWADKVYRHDNKNEWRVIGHVNLKRIIEDAVLKDAVFDSEEEADAYYSEMAGFTEAVEMESGEHE